MTGSYDYFYCHYKNNNSQATFLDSKQEKHLQMRISCLYFNQLVKLTPQCLLNYDAIQKIW